MATTYSVRFLAANLSNSSATYTVPSRKRAVIKFISATSFGTAVSQATLRVAGFAVVNFDLPVSTNSKFVEVRAIAYAGEAVVATCVGPDVRFYASGYLFDDPGTSGGATKPIEPDEPGAILPMPWEPMA